MPRLDRVADGAGACWAREESCGERAAVVNILSRMSRDKLGGILRSTRERPVAPAIAREGLGGLDVRWGGGGIRTEAVEGCTFDEARTHLIQRLWSSARVTMGGGGGDKGTTGVLDVVVPGCALP